MLRTELISRASMKPTWKNNPNIVSCLVKSSLGSLVKVRIEPCV